MRHHSRLAVKPVEPLTLKPKVKSGDTSHEDHHSSPRRGSKAVGVVEEGRVVSLKPDTSKALLVSVGHVHITKDDLVLKVPVCICTYVRTCVCICVLYFGIVVPPQGLILLTS